MAALAACGFPSPAFAINPACNVSSAGGSFGTVDVLAGSAVDSSSTFTVSCTGNANATLRLCIEMGPGNSTDASGNRVLVSGANTLRHEFYTSAARTTIWGSWGSIIVAYTPFFGLTYDLALNGSGSGSHAFTLYGRILSSQQTTNPGSYSWNSGSPGITYDYFTGASCLTGTHTAIAGAGSTIWTATVNSNCTVAATALSFGSKGLLTSVTDASNTLAVDCTSTTPYTVSLNGGNANASDPAQRKMSAGAQNVTYGIYRDAARSLPWGSTTGTNTQSGTGTGAAASFTGYGRVPVQTTPAPGTYSDTVVVTVTY